MDACVSGDVLIPYASASLREVFYKALRGVPAPGKSYYEERSYYEHLEEYYQNDKNPPKNITEKLKILSSGSDQDTFTFYAGVPATYHKFM